MTVPVGTYRSYKYPGKRIELKLAYRTGKISLKLRNFGQLLLHLPESLDLLIGMIDWTVLRGLA